MSINCIIIDDDPAFTKYCESLIKQNTQLNHLASYSDPHAAIGAFDDLDVELIFLDVEMPSMSGFEFLNQLKDVPPVIFISSKSEYAIDAFKFKAANYLKKPFDKEVFNKAVDELVKSKFANNRSGIVRDSFFVKDKSRLFQIAVQDILYIEALSDYSQIHTTTKKYTVLSSLKVLMSILPPEQFFRTHRSFIVNKKKIKELDESVISLGDYTVPLSRSHRSAFMDWIYIL
ncbi:MAG: LytR/AlgR family response regulator transcription factor [Flavobacteriales bacterium]